MFKGGIPENAELLLDVTRMAMILKNMLSKHAKGNGQSVTLLCQGEGGEVEMETQQIGAADGTAR